MVDRTMPSLVEGTSLLGLVRAKLAAPVTAGRWRAATSAAILLLLLLQVVTGFAITSYYVPSSPHAHASVLYLMKEVPGGSLLRAIHHYGAHALVVISAIYLLQLFYSAAYKQQRKVVWISSVLLFGLIFAFCFTGQLLPWDQKGYYGMRVGANIVGQLPLIGDTLRQFFIGDVEISTLTLSRFFALHIIALPAIALLLLRIASFAAKGAEGPPKPQGVFEAYYPDQFAREVFTSAFVFVLVVLLAWRFGSPLEPVADSSDTSYIARPEWFFLPLFQFRKILPDRFEGIGAMLFTLVSFGLLLAIPYIDRGAEKSLRSRKLPGAILAGLAVVVLALIVTAVIADRAPDVKEQLARQHEQSAELLAGPFRPIPVGRATPAPVIESSVTSVVDQPPVVKTFIGLCAPCHGPQATGGTLGPSLIGLAAKRHYTKEELIELLSQPMSHGLSEAMPAFSQLSKDKREEVAAWLIKLDSPDQLATAAKVLKPPPFLFVQNCAGCHGPQAEGGFGPRLLGVGSRRSREKIIQLIANPTGAGLNNIMPPFPELSEAERAEIADWLVTLK